METILRFNPATGEILNVSQDPHPERYADRPDVLIDPVIPDGPWSRNKVVNRLVVRKSTAELAAMDAAEVEANVMEADRQQKRTTAMATLSSLRGVDPTAAQIKDAVKALVVLKLLDSQ